MKKMLQQAPLVHAVIHLEISRCPDLKLSKPEIEDVIQSQMIDLGFPDYIVGEHRIVEFGPNQGPDGSIAPQRESITPRRIFRSGSQMELLEVTESAVILKSSEYTTFENFSSTFFKALDCLLEQIPLCRKTVLKRIGLRYIDVIAPSPGLQLSDHVISDIMPASLPQLDGSRKLNGLMLTRASTNEGTIKVALEELPVIKSSVHKVLPENLGEPDNRCVMKLRGQEWWNNLTSDTYGILDIDHVHIFQDTPTMDEALLSDRLNSLYKATSEVFWSLITDKSKEAWGMTEKSKEELA